MLYSRHLGDLTELIFSWDRQKPGSKGEENGFSDCDAGDKGNKWTEKITHLDSMVTGPFQRWELDGGAVQES